MYLRHWALTRPPFARVFHGNWYFEGPAQEEALARMFYLTENRHQVGILCGQMGVGKSWLLAAFAQQLNLAGCQVASMNMQGMDLTDFWWKLAESWALNPAIDEAPLKLWRKIGDHLQQQRLIDQPTVLLLDDADECQPETLQGLLRLIHALPGEQTLLSVVLACRPQGLTRFGSRLTEHSHLMVHLDPLSYAETKSYIAAALAYAGRTEMAFTNSALLRLHELSDGLIRRITHLADLSLAAAAAQKLPCVDAETIDNVYHELGASHITRLSA